MKRISALILSMVVLCWGFSAFAVETTKIYTIPGALGNVNISYTSVDYQGKQQCWAYANKIYNIIWKYDFTSSFGTSDNMLRNLSDDARRITAANAKKFITQAPLGAVIRIASARKDVDNHHGFFESDNTGTYTDKKTGKVYTLATGKRKEGHSMVIVAKSLSGVTFIENRDSGRNEQTLTWDQFANAYASKYIYFKYIKYPNAQPYKSYDDVSTIELRDIVYPATFKVDTTNGWNLSGGILVSNVELQSVSAKIIDSNNNVISAMKSPKPISGKVYSIKDLDGKKVDNGQLFSKIKNEGNYKWIITATDINNRTVTLEMAIKAVKSGSTVTAKASKKSDASDPTMPPSPTPTPTPTPSVPEYSTLEFQGVTCPVNYKIGSSNGYLLSGGTLVSNEELKTITSTIKKKDGTVISGPKTRNISGKSYAIKNLDTMESGDNGVKFSWIKTAGDYVWVLTATDASKSWTLEMPFTASSNATTSQNVSSKYTPSTIPVTQVVLNYGYMSARSLDFYGDYVALQAYVYPDNATNNSIAWSSSDESVVVVDGNGRVYFKGNGKATVTAKATDGSGCYDTCEFEIAIDPTGISLDQNYIALDVNQTAKLIATVEPENALNKNVIWSSDNSDVAEVADGIITAKSPGFATITATTEVDGWFGQPQVSCTVLVTDNSGIAIDETNFPDDIFREVVRQYDTNGNGRLTDDERDAVTVIDVNNMGVGTVKGIEFFTKLKKLWCVGNSLSELDVSRNSELEILWCFTNNLTELDVRNNINLIELSFGGNQLTSVDISQNTQLLVLDCEKNQITNLNLDNNNVLQQLWCDKNPMVSIDITSCPHLVKLVDETEPEEPEEGIYYWRKEKDINNYSYVLYADKSVKLYKDRGVEINESNFPDDNFREYLKNYDVNGNDWLSDDELIQINIVDISFKKISSLQGIEYLKYLTILDCSYNQLTSLDLSGNTLLEELACYSNKLQTLNLSKNTQLNSLDCGENMLKTLDVSKNTELINLYCENNLLTQLDVSKNTKLTRLVSRYNNIAQLDIRDCPELVKLATTIVCEDRSDDGTYCWNDERVDEWHPTGVYLFKYTLIVDKTTRLTATDSDPEQEDKVAAFVTRCYNIILGREPDEGGMTTWLYQLNNGLKAASEIIDRFVNSPEFKGKQYSNEKAVEILYKVMMNRDPEPAGKAHWISKLENGDPFAVVINGFCISAEFAGICESYGIKPGSVKIDENAVKEGRIKAFVKRCYRLILNREPDEGGMQTWYNELSSGRKSASEIIDRFVNSLEFSEKNYGPEDSVEILYKAMLGRGSDAAGKANWVGKLDAGQPFAVVINGFCVSKEFTGICASYGIKPGSVTIAPLSGVAEEEALSMLAYKAKAPITKKSETNPTRVEIINPSDTIDMNIGTAVQAVYINEEKAKEFISRCYQCILGREASTAELENWIGQMTNGTKTPDQIARGFLFSSEFKGKNVSNEELVKILYKVYMNRDVDPEGLTTWTEKLDRGTNLNDLLNTFSKTSEYKNTVSEMGR